MDEQIFHQRTDLSELNDAVLSIRNEIKKIIVGQDEMVKLIIAALLADGHVLIEGVPGVAKTLTAKLVAKSVNVGFSRIQFTPDLMPSDVTGTEILENDNTGKKIFKFIKGPVFANIVLADEINRTPPKTQSALLEAMQEHRVTAAGNSYTLDEPFFVLATQNPIEQEGTYPLPEAQLDRFMFNLWLDYPSFNEELQIIKQTTSMYMPELKKILSKEEIMSFQDLVRKVPVADEVINYAVSIVSKTRPVTADSPKIVKDYISWGAGPRASQYLVLGAKTNCILEGRYSPDIEDIKKVTQPVLRHRLITNFNAEADGLSVLNIINEIVRE